LFNLSFVVSIFIDCSTSPFQDEFPSKKKTWISEQKLRGWKFDPQEEI
jgi:hypothetical protein